MKNKTGRRFKIVSELAFEDNNSKLADALSMKPGAFQKYINGDTMPGGNILIRLKTIGVNLNWFLTGQGDHFNPDKLPAGLKQNRLYILRHRSQIFHGTPRIAAEKLGVSEETYRNWELGLEEIPSSLVDKIYDMVDDHIRKEWWYEGKGDIYLPGVGLPVVNEGQVEYYPVKGIDDYLKKDIQDCISEMVNRQAKHDREIFGELLKIKLREAGILDRKN